MTREVTSKHIDGIADLVVVAPIRDGFIDAYENVTYETRLRIVGNALHDLRVAAREFEPDTPFSDVTERIMTLLNFRITIHDDDLFQIDPLVQSPTKLKPRRYLYLTATFDGALEPYMRLIWRPLGIFLDLLFCNCEGYKPAGDHGFPEYFDWVKRSQRESAIFYSTTGATVRDQIYLRTLERLQRELDPADADLALCRLTMPDREAEAAADRSGPKEAKAHKLALEALNVLYRLADYYPPDRLDPIPPPEDGQEWLAGAVPNHTYAEGRYLLRAARSLLLGWDTRRLPPEIRRLYQDQLDWFESRADLSSQEKPVADPPFDERQVQAGILTSPGTLGRAVRHGALMLMTVTDAVAARSFIAGLPISFEGDPPPPSGLYHSIAFTAHGLTRLGLFESKRLRFPKEFREGMEKRSGLLGDFRENHPRNWKLPRRNWPPLAEEPARPRPPIDTSEIDFIIQIRYAAPIQDMSDAPVQNEIARLAALAEQSGVVLAGYEPMVGIFEQPRPGEPPSDISGHFKLRDGISQPIPRPGLRDLDVRGRDDVRLGEIVCGYSNDRGDQAPPPPEPGSSKPLQDNGSFLVIRKLRQNVEAYFDYLAAESRRIAVQHQIPFGPDDLAARLWGRRPDGTPLVPHKPGSLNEFDYTGDAHGDFCPHASHVRRTNPRDSFLGRPAPRIMRRGMSYDAHGGDNSRGVMFMAYCSSIAEQFEVVQRWVNGGNSTGIGSANNDPLVGIPPPDGALVHRFVVDGKVIRTIVPRNLIELQWGLYLFSPSRDALAQIRGFTGDVRDIDEPRESRGKKMIALLGELPKGLQRLEWKRVLEDFDSKDPAERNRSPDIWSAIRWYEGGSYRLPFGQEFAKYIKGKDAPNAPSDPGKTPSIVLVASREHVKKVLSEPETFSVEIQGNRIHRTSGDSYVAMQPDERYYSESRETNEIMFAQSSEAGFKAGYSNAAKVLAQAVGVAEKLGRDSFKLELRRDFIMPTLAGMCADWFGLPDGIVMEPGAWSWAGGDRKARCPGDFLSPSRHAFYAEALTTVEGYAKDHGARIRAAGEALVARYRRTGELKGVLAAEMARRIWARTDLDDDAKADLLARNIIGMMIGFLPPADGNLRSILYEWLSEKRLWRHQAALRREAKDGPVGPEAAAAALRPAIFRAMGKRPVPDLLLRVATRDYSLEPLEPDLADEPKDNGVPRAPKPRHAIEVCKGDVVLVSLVSASQRALRDKTRTDGDPFFVFGGERLAPKQPDGASLHACPAYKLMVGGMTGILAALLEVGQIRAMPSSLIVEISNWKNATAAPPPAPPA